MNRPLNRIIKRQSYNDYSKFADSIPAVLERLVNTKRGDLAEVSNQTGIPYSTISRWHQALGKNTRFNPLDRKWGQHKRIFTDQEEDMIADYIVLNYIQPGIYFTDEDFKELALQAWQEKYLPIYNSDDPEIRKQFKEFHCSRGFIVDFKYHHNFSSKVFHIKRRANPNSPIEQKFLKEMANLFEHVPLSRILNADETGWKLFPKGILSWGETGIDNMSRQGSVSDKSQVTVLATIAADYTKLPLLFVAQGKTEQVESSQIGDIGYHWKTHTESGWVNDVAFSFYLHKLRQHFNDDEPLHLIMDLYPSHMTKQVLDDAKDLNIILHIIPAGMTDFYQPLDRKVFGVVKAKARKFFRQRHSKESHIKGTKLEACQDMIAAWEGVARTVISSAWEIYTENADEIPKIKEKEEHEQLLRHHREFVENTRKEKIQKRIETRNALNYKDDLFTL